MTNPRPTNPDRTRNPLKFLGAAFTGVLIVLAFPRYGFEVGLDWISWFALVPLFFVAVGSGGWRGAVLGWASGLTLESGGFIWILVAIRRFTELPDAISSSLFLGWLLYASLPWAALGLALGRCRRPAGVLWVLPLWVGVEYYFPRLFPWTLGGAFYGREWLVQNADLLGVSGLTALVFLGNVAVFLLVGFFRKKHSFPVKTLVGFVAMLAAALIYGRFRLAEIEGVEAVAPTLDVACIQGARVEKRRSAPEDLAAYLGMSLKVQETAPVDLVVWPEGADPYAFDLTPGNDPWRGHRRDRSDPEVLLRDALTVPLVTGGTGYRADRALHWSGLAAYLRPGKKPLFYEKNVRLLFGEYVPFGELIPQSWRDALGIRVATVAAGKTNPSFQLQGSSFKNLICYEAVLPDYFRAAASGVDFLINITEDIWYGRTSHISQHASVLILRVVENRTPLVRATNMGPSGVIDISGRFRHVEKIFAPDVFVGPLRAGSAGTFYRSAGHLFPFAMLLLVVGRWALLRFCFANGKKFAAL